MQDPRRRQRAFTSINEILPDKVETLGRLLSKIGKSPSRNSYISFSDVKCLHFASWTILPTEAQYPPLLVFEATYDGEQEAFLDELIKQGRSAFDQIYALCKHCPSSRTADPIAFKRYLSTANCAPAGLFVGLPDQSVASISNAVEVRRAVETYLETERLKEDWRELSTDDVWNRIRLAFPLDGELPLFPSSVTLDEEGRIERRNRRAAFVVGIPTALCLSPLLLVALLLIRLTEVREGRRTDSRPALGSGSGAIDETNRPQNHMVTLAPIKPGLVRLWTLKTVLWSFGIAGSALQRSGSILGISTIHFVRWIFINDQKRLLFLANYDGTWAAYLGDFVDCASWVLNSIWSNTEQFPATEWLFFKGARRIQEFKKWTQRHNLESPVWYSAYPESTVSNLRRDISIRDALAGALTSKAEHVLRLL